MNADVGSNDQARAEAEWMADAIRLAFFPAGPREWPHGLLEKLLGQPAELEQTSKRGALVTNLEALKRGAHQINAVSQPTRLDVHISVAQMPEETETIVRPANHFRELVELVATKGSEMGPFARLAVSASLIRPCSSKAEVYRLINQRFPCLNLDPETSDDLLLQMNRLLADDLGRINRIERWSYGLFERIDIPVMGVTPEVGNVAKRLEGVKLDLDFNTVIQQDRSFDAEASKRVVRLLIDAMYEKMKVE
jgi:hypothetical protein